MFGESWRVWSTSAALKIGVYSYLWMPLIGIWLVATFDPHDVDHHDLYMYAPLSTAFFLVIHLVIHLVVRRIQRGQP
jgi:hypothetical protein